MDWPGRCGRRKICSEALLSRVSHPNWTQGGVRFLWRPAFLTVFGVLVAVYYILAMWVPFDRLLCDSLRLNTWLSGGILDLFGQWVTVSGVEIQSAKAILGVRKAAHGVEAA